MARFHFNIEGSVDADGVDLPDLTTAKRQALAKASRIMADELTADLWKSDDWSMEVTDAKGLRLFSLYVTGIEEPAFLAPAYRT